MRLVFLLLAGCWRPAPYVPPESPLEDAPAEEQPEAAPADEVEPGSDPGEAAADSPEDPDGQPEEPPFDAYMVRTLQSPVTLVDDYGQPLSVIPTAGAILEVRGQDEIRARVWCATCTPPVEGWVQIHLIERMALTDGSK